MKRMNVTVTGTKIIHSFLSSRLLDRFDRWLHFTVVGHF